jgi:hypothetical protein
MQGKKKGKLFGQDKRGPNPYSARTEITDNPSKKARGRMANPIRISATTSSREIERQKREREREKDR